MDPKSSLSKVDSKSNAYSTEKSKHDYYRNTPPASNKPFRVLFITPRGLFNTIKLGHLT